MTSFDAHLSDDPSEYRQFVGSLRAATITGLRRANRDPAAERDAIERYIRTAYDAHLSPAEIIDFLGVDTPSVIDEAGLDANDGDRVMAIFDDLNFKLFPLFYPEA